MQKLLCKICSNDTFKLYAETHTDKLTSVCQECGNETGVN